MQSSTGFCPIWRLAGCGRSLAGAIPAYENRRGKIVVGAENVGWLSRQCPKARRARTRVASMFTHVASEKIGSVRVRLPSGQTLSAQVRNPECVKRLAHRPSDIACNSRGLCGEGVAGVERAKTSQVSHQQRRYV